MKNKKFEIKNLLGNSQKRTYRREIWRQRVGGVAWTLFILLFAFLIYNQNSKSSVSQPLSQTISNPIVEVKAQENKYTSRGYKYCYDPIVCIRDVGEELGMSNKDITTMIRIAKCESGFKPDAKNGSSTATGIFQVVIGTWDGNRCEGERWDFIDNIKCGWKIYQARGTQPWVSSQGCWNK